MFFYPIICSLLFLLLTRPLLAAPGGTAKVDPLVLTPISGDDTNWRRGNQRRGSDGPATVGSVVLTPMSDESALWGRGGYGNRKRGHGGPDFSRLDLQKQEHFLYGSHAGESVPNPLNPGPEGAMC